MSHARGLPHHHHHPPNHHHHPPHTLHRKAVPPGSLLYEQVLDDLRNNSSSPSSSESSSSLSSSPPSLSHPSHTDYRPQVNGQTNCAINTANSDLDSWTFQKRAARAGTNGDWLCPCNVCTGVRGRRKGGEGETGVVGRVEEGWRGEGCGGDGSCVQVWDFVEDLNLEEAGQTTDSMGHSTSLLNHHHHRHHHRHHKRDYVVRDDTPSPHPHPHPRDVASPHQKRQTSGSTSKDQTAKLLGGGRDTSSPTPTPTTRVSRSFSLPTAAMTSRGHVIRWSAASCGEERGNPRLVVEGCEDPGCSPSRAHAPVSRLSPRLSSASQGRQASPSPSGTRGQHGRPHSSPPSRERSHRQQGRGEEGGSRGRRKEEAGKSPTPSPKRRLFPDLHLPRSKSPSIPTPTAHLLSPAPIPSLQRRGSYELPRGTALTWEGSSSSSSLTVPTPSPHSPRDPIHLCQFTLDLSPADDDVTDRQLPEIPDSFRMRSHSDVSMHVQRDGRLPRLPLLRQRSRLEEDEEGEEDNHAHVHWADERRGSPLVTSILLHSLRPRALSHGSADLPRKPILKKPLGF